MVMAVAVEHGQNVPVNAVSIGNYCNCLLLGHPLSDQPFNHTYEAHHCTSPQKAIEIEGLMVS